MRLRPAARRAVRAMPRWACQRWSSTSSFTVYGAGSKAELIQAITKKNAKSTSSHDAIVILASRPYASWLSDQEFMTDLLSSLSTSEQGAQKEDINVLSAAVDALLPRSQFAQARHGFSVYQGSLNRLLPDLWANEFTPDARGRTNDQGFISFQTDHSLTTNSSNYSLACSLPLANTVFQNNRPFTLLATRWRRLDAGSPPELTSVISKQMQLVDCTSPAVSDQEPGKRKACEVTVPIVPVTPPRKIVAGLGNIVRQIDINGKTSPASSELEPAVQSMYEMWAGSEGYSATGPMGVWALIIPPEVVEAADIELLGQWRGKLTACQTLEEQVAAALGSSAYFPSLLARGGRISQVLSGGGGWGKKQGLLSLDPDNKPGAPENEFLEGMESLVRSLEGEQQHDERAKTDKVAPGSVVQFFLAPSAGIENGFMSGKGGTSETPLGGRGCGFGVTPRVSEEPESSSSGEAWEVVDGAFGAVSSESMFISDKVTFAANGRVLPGAGFETKITAPDSFIRVV